MLRKLRSIRVRLTLWYTMIFLPTLFGFGAVIYYAAGYHLLQNLDRSLRAEAVWFTTFPFRDKDFPPDHPPLHLQGAPTAVEPADSGIGRFLSLHYLLDLKPEKKHFEVSLVSTGALVGNSNPFDPSIVVDSFPKNYPMLTTVSNSEGEAYRVASYEANNRQVTLGYPLAELKAVQDNIFRMLVILIPAALIIALLGGWIVAIVSLRPVDLVTRAARKITAHRLDQRIPERKVDDELGRLVSTFNDMIARLEQSFNQIRQFSLAASHELRTPLTIMRGETELALRNPRTPEKYRDVLRSQLEEILRLSSIVEDLLTTSDVEQVHQHQRFEFIDLRSMVSTLYEDGLIIAEKKGISLNLSRNEEMMVLGDKVRLRQLFLNLLDNAIKYTPEKGVVTLSSGREDGNAVVQVSDTGIGIPRADQDKIFERFYRVEKARSRDFGGAGLGLSIAKWVAELHSGNIEVESEEGRGSTFTVRLPLNNLGETGRVESA